MSPEDRAKIEKLKDFSVASINWCARESEKAIVSVGTVLDDIQKDAVRVSNMSEETIKAVDIARELIDSLGAGKRDAIKANKLVQALRKIGDHNLEIQNVMTPIVESLQFQDRVTQRMDNLGKMLAYWFEVHEQISNETQASTITDFGNELLKLTTMKEERDLVRAIIPNLDDNEVATQSDVMFF